MLDPKHKLLKVNPVIQFAIILTIVAAGLLLSKSSLLKIGNDWDIVCYAMLIYICMNCILGIFQLKTIPYLPLSFVVYIALLFSFLLLGKFHIIDSIKTTSSQQLVLLACTVFYIVISVVTQLIRFFYKHSQHI